MKKTESLHYQMAGYVAERILSLPKAIRILGVCLMLYSEQAHQSSKLPPDLILFT